MMSSDLPPIVPRHPITYDLALTRCIIRAIWGPTKFRARAAKALGCSISLIDALLSGQRRPTIRHRAIFKASAELAPSRLRKERQREIARLTELYERHVREVQSLGNRL